MLESDILYTAVENLERLTGVSVQVDLASDSYDNGGGDGVITIKKNGLTTKLYVDVKREIHQSNLHFLLDQFKEEKNRILISRYISGPGKRVLEENKINYLDLAGNCRIETSGGIFFHIKGEKQKGHQKIRKYRAFNNNGIKLIYALLLDDELINEPYRQLADLANISLSTVGGILKGLQSEGYIRQINKERKKICNKKELLSHWVRAFNLNFKPKLLRGRYRFGKPYSTNSWRGLDLGSFAFWGGEPAADHYTNYLQPEIWTIYTNLDKKALIYDLHLRPDPEEGIVEVYELFWKLESSLFTDKAQNTVSPLLSYAELLGTEESRNLEVAHRIYETHLKDIFE